MRNISAMSVRPDADVRKNALRFVILVGVLSLFADATYEASRSIVGPYLALLGAGAFTIAVVSGIGEFLGYGLRLVSGRAADATGKFWPITIFGYFVQMLSVPALALVGTWQAAAALIILERIGRAIRNPPRDVMLSHAGKQIGHGWAFGLHEALDQSGAVIGPLLVAFILFRRADYRLAFAALIVPAVTNLLVLLVAHHLYPRPEEMESATPNVEAAGLPRVFWVYLVGACLVAAGFVDYPLMAYHLQRTAVVRQDIVPIFYAVAMGASGTGSFVLGRVYDRRGFIVLIVLTLVTTLFAPLVFFGGFWTALVGMGFWGLGIGVHESLIPAAVAPLVAANRRASAYGLFTAGYGLCWFLGSAAIGFLYSRSEMAAMVFCVVAELAAVPVFLSVRRHYR